MMPFKLTSKANASLHTKAKRKLCGGRSVREQKVTRAKTPKEMAEEKLAAIDAEAKLIIDSGGVLKSEPDSAS